MTRTITQGDRRSLRRIIRKHIVRSDRDFGMLRTEYIERVEVDDMAAALVEWADRRALRTASAPAPSVVPEAAVEALREAAVEAVAWKLIDCTSDLADRAPSDETRRTANADARAALPLLTAAPSATRDEIAGHTIGSGYYGTSVSVEEAAEIADTLLARFNITPKEDR